MMERRRGDSLKGMYERPLDMDNGVGIDCGSRGWDEQRRAKRGQLGQLLQNNNKNDFKKETIDPGFPTTFLAGTSNNLLMVLPLVLILSMGYMRVSFWNSSGFFSVYTYIYGNVILKNPKCHMYADY